MNGPAPALPLSIDWEDWFQLCCPPFDAVEALDRFECRLPLATDLVLQLCEDLGARGTWFCLVDQARRHPRLIDRIHKAGHRIGLHGLTHRRAFELDRRTFRAHLDEGKKSLEDLIGAPVLGYRAPEWSLRGLAVDYWQEVLELGFQFDSSRAPLAYLGSRAWPRLPHRLGGTLWELPPPVVGLGQATVPLWGWGLRVLPKRWLRSKLQTLAQNVAGTPLVLHPWELDEAQPPLSGCTLGHHFAHSVRLRRYGNRLRWLLKDLRLTSIEEWISSQDVEPSGGLLEKLQGA